MNGENGDNYSIKNFVETKSKEQNSNTINKSSVQINNINKLHSPDVSNSIAWQNQDLDQLTKVTTYFTECYYLYLY